MKIRLVAGPPTIHEVAPRCLHVRFPAEFFECFDQTSPPIDNGAKGVEHNCPDGAQFSFKLFHYSSLQKPAKSSGVAEEFRCLRLHRSQISKDLWAVQASDIVDAKADFRVFCSQHLAPSTTYGQYKQLFELGEHPSRKFTPRRYREHDRNVDRMVRFLSI